MIEEVKKSLLYRMRVIGFLILAFIFFIGWWVFNSIRNDIFDQATVNQISDAELKLQLSQNANSFFIFIGFIFILMVIWTIIVRRENRKVREQQVSLFNETANTPIDQEF